MGFYANCKACGEPVYVYQNFDGSWSQYADMDLSSRHVCQGVLNKTSLILGNIFEIGSCGRKIGYKLLYHSGEQEFSYKAWEAFYVGRAGESYIKDILFKKGCKIINKQKDVNFMGFNGMIDGMLLKDNELMLLECKTFRDSEKFVDFISESLKENHVRYYSQIQAYMASVQVKKCFLVAMGQAVDDWHEQTISMDTEFLTGLQLKITRMRKKIEQGELPEPDPSSKPYLECQYCSYNGICDFNPE